MNPYNTKDMFDLMSTDEIRVTLVAAAANLAQRWMPSVPGAQDHIDAGAESVMEVKLTPAVTVSLVLVDSDGSRYPLAWRA